MTEDLYKPMSQSKLQETIKLSQIQLLDFMNKLVNNSIAQTMKRCEIRYSNYFKKYNDLTNQNQEHPLDKTYNFILDKMLKEVNNPKLDFEFVKIFITYIENLILPGTTVHDIKLALYCKIKITRFNNIYKKLDELKDAIDSYIKNKNSHNHIEVDLHQDNSSKQAIDELLIKKEEYMNQVISYYNISMSLKKFYEKIPEFQEYNYDKIISSDIDLDFIEQYKMFYKIIGELYQKNEDIQKLEDTLYNNKDYTLEDIYKLEKIYGIIGGTVLEQSFYIFHSYNMLFESFRHIFLNNSNSKNTSLYQEDRNFDQRDEHRKMHEVLKQGKSLKNSKLKKFLVEPVNFNTKTSNKKVTEPYTKLESRVNSPNSMSFPNGILPDPPAKNPDIPNLVTGNAPIDKNPNPKPNVGSAIVPMQVPVVLIPHAPMQAHHSMRPDPHRQVPVVLIPHAPMPPHHGMRSNTNAPMQAHHSMRPDPPMRVPVVMIPHAHMQAHHGMRSDPHRQAHHSIRPNPNAPIQARMPAPSFGYPHHSRGMNYNSF